MTSVEFLPLPPLHFFPDDLLMGYRPGIGLVTGWTDHMRYNSPLILERVEAVGNLYSAAGIGRLIRNVLARPSIRALVMTGVPNPSEADDQADHLRDGDFDPAPLGLTDELVAEFYQRVLIYDARHIPPTDHRALAHILDGIVLPEGDLPEPIIIEAPEIKTATFPTHPNGHVFSAATVYDAYRQVLRDIRRHGHYTTPDKEGHFRQELLTVVVRYDPATTPTDIPHYSDESIATYGRELFYGHEPRGVAYEYGRLLRTGDGLSDDGAPFDQIATGLDILTQRQEAYSVFFSLWNPKESMRRSNEACLVTLHPLVRGGKLHVTAQIRTNEAFRGYPKNVGGLLWWQRLFAQELSERVGKPIGIGSLVTISNSMHIYDERIAAVDEWLGEAKPGKLLLDPMGDWNLYREPDGTFVAEHYADGMLLQTLRAASIDRMWRQLEGWVSDLSHAFYLGRVLSRLEQGMSPRAAADFRVKGGRG